MLVYKHDKYGFLTSRYQYIEYCYTIHLSPNYPTELDTKKIGIIWADQQEKETGRYVGY